MKRLCTLFFGLGLSSLALSLQAGLPELSADDPIVFDHKTQAMTASGNAELRHDDFLFQADEISVSQVHHEARAQGNVRFTKGEFRAVASSLEYDFEEIAITSENFRLGVYPNYFSGSLFSGNASYIDVQNAELHYGEPGAFGLSMKAQSIEGKPGGKIKAKHAVFKWGPVPFFYTPWLTADTSGYPLDISTKFGYGGDHGPHVRNKFLVRTTPELGVGILADYYVKRGFLIGPAYEYNIKNSDADTRSSFYSGYLHDLGKRDNDRLGRSIGQDRHFIELRHQQAFTDEFQVTSSVSVWSDSESLREFRPSIFSENENPDTFVEAVYTGENYFLTGFTRMRPNSFQLIGQKLPELTFDYLPTAIADTGIYQTAKSSVGYMHEKPLADASLANRKVTKMDGYYGLNYPISLSECMRITPVLGGRVTHYQPAHGSRDFTRIAGELGFDLDMKAYGQWDYVNSTWDIDSLRHLLTPKVQYRFIPVKGNGNAKMASMDRSFENNLKDPLELSNTRKLDPKNNTHVVRFGLDNWLQTRDKEYGSRDLIYLGVYQDIKLNTIAGERTLNDSYIFTELYPAAWLRLDAFTRQSTSDMTLRELNTGVTLIDGDIWDARLGTNYLKPDVHQYDIRFNYNLNARYRLISEWLFNANKGGLVRQSYGLSTLVGNIWRVDYQVAIRKKTSLASKVSFNVSVELLSF